MAVPKITPPKIVQGKAGRIQSLKSLLQRPAMQKEKGMSVKAKPKKVIGG